MSTPEDRARAQDEHERVIAALAMVPVDTARKFLVARDALRLIVASSKDPASVRIAEAALRT